MIEVVVKGGDGGMKGGDEVKEREWVRVMMENRGGMGK